MTPDGTQSSTPPKHDKHGSAQAQTHNHHGLAGLPLELLLWILSYTHTSIIPWNRQRPMPANYRERRDILRALCQVCRSLRIALLPILWERLDACTIHPTCVNEHDPKLPKLVIDELSDQIWIMAMPNQPFSSYVRIVNVAVEPQFAETTLRSLTQCLTLLPNLHTVQIICRTTGPMILPKTMIGPMRTGDERFHIFEQTFAGRCYPSVRCVSLPIEALSTFACFPELVEVHLNQKIFLGFAPFISSMARHCPKVESFGWCESAPEWRFTEVVNVLPNLRRIRCPPLLKPGNITKLAKLPNFDTFALDVAEEELTKRDFDTIEAAKRMLSAVHNARLELYFPSGIKTTIFHS